VSSATIILCVASQRMFVVVISLTESRNFWTHTRISNIVYLTESDAGVSLRVGVVFSFIWIRPHVILKHFRVRIVRFGSVFSSKVVVILFSRFSTYTAHVVLRIFPFFLLNHGTCSCYLGYPRLS
jgi:hypothetical protein